MSTTAFDADLQKAGRLLANARHAIAFTGAGISTPSGIPDFRSKNTGLWERYDPAKVVSIEVFLRQPEHFYGWLRPLLRQIWQSNPNPAHTALAQLENAGLLKAVITQNIDDLHQRAGSKNVYEVHGSLRTLTCPSCQICYPSDTFQAALSAADEMAHCPACSRVVKPDITLYGEMLPMQTWTAAERHCQQADLVLIVGSSLEVWPAASLPELCADNGAAMIINNFTATHLDQRADVLLPMDVAEALPAIAAYAIQT